MAHEPVVIVQMVGFAVFLWLGLYLSVRVARPTPLIGAGLVALLGQAAFFGSSVLTFSVRELPTLALLERSFWWSAVLPVAAWYHFSDQIAQQFSTASPPRTWRPTVIGVYCAAALIIVLGTTTDLFLRFGAPTTGPGPRAMYLERGVLYPAQVAFLALAGLGATLNLARALGRLQRSAAPSDQALAHQLWLLVSGAIPFLAGGLYVSSRYLWDPASSVLPGYLLLLAGLGLLGYGIAHFGLLLDGQDIQRDFVYNSTGIGIVTLAYVGLLAATGTLSPSSLLAIVGLTVLTHTLFDSGRRLLDRIFFNPAEQVARAEAREYATALGTLPVAAPALPLEQPEPTDQPEDPSDAALAPSATDQKAFNGQVRKAITSLKSPPQLAQSPLLALELVTRRVAESGLADNRLNRASALRELLIEQIELLRPAGDETLKVGDAWRFYNVLYIPYVRELSRKGALAEARRLSEERRRNGQRQPGDLEQVLDWVSDVEEDTYYKWQRRASDSIAQMLWEENAKAQA